MDPGELRPVRLRIPDPSLHEKFSAHYARAGFVVRRLDENELDVERPDAPDLAQERREVVAHLLVWDVLHPESPGEVVE